ncbi:uncharacterized protein LOC132981846 isoform X2 [Labrus mixtus]|uniref:uncharacterized protein LOC132981846 isoform X2 n=1 Tax=Labrus mixtus TaxID=508554 RepID=UPI0029BFD55C|nr:uncharacterized protein LOC132981846 isoform X2 [Labrus mixtus]
MEVMMVVFLLWGFFAMGFSYDEIEYGGTYRIKLPRKTQSVGFIKLNIQHATTLWNRDEPLTGYNSKHRVQGSYFFVEEVNHNDSGSYLMKDKDEKVISTKTMEVIAIRRYNTKTVGRYFDFTFNVGSDSCNIYFIPDGGYETQIVRKGKLLEHDDQDCNGFDLSYPCGISKNYMQLSCNGRFEVRDKHGDLALVETVEVENSAAEEEDHEPTFDTSTSIGIGIGAILGGLSCCCCTIRFCKSISSSNKDKSESPDEEPTAHYRQYEREPVRPSSDQLSRPSETLYPTVPPYNLSVPLIHNPPPPSVSVPPAYSEVSAPAEQAVAPTFPVPSEDPEPRFELSISSALPLSSDSTFSDVYTSDKLNF